MARNTRGGSNIPVPRSWTPSGLPHFDWAIVAFGLRAVAAVSGAPANTGLPVITVAPEGPGYVLTATTGTWANSPTSFSYEWRVAPDDVAPPNGSTVGSESTLHLRWPVGSGYYTVVVTATNAAGSGKANAYVHLTPASFTVVALPSIFGVPRVGQALSGGFGGYLGVQTGAPDWTSGNFGAVWLRCDVAGVKCVAVQTDIAHGWPPIFPHYVVTAADAGSTLRLLAETTVLPGTSRPIGAVSAPTAVVTP